MLTAAQRKKKRIALIAVWVIYSIAASLFLFHLAREKTSDKAQEDLYVQADSIAAQIPSVLENSLYCEISSLKMKTAKPKVRYERRTDKESLLRTRDKSSVLCPAQDLCKPVCIGVITVCGLCAQLKSCL